VFAELRRQRPSISIERLRVTYPADDDNLWFGTAEVQIECHPGGRAPFLVEGKEPKQRRETASVEDAVGLILSWLT
jgi:hypothetical protein